MDVHRDRRRQPRPGGGRARPRDARAHRAGRAAARVYIIDEVHMLSTHAFNALLKLVEEPPPHVVFILATTDTHKVPATIISRTQRFDFRRLPAASDRRQAGAHRGRRGGARLSRRRSSSSPELADGGMRDAESMLDQVLAYRRRPGHRRRPCARRSGLPTRREVGALMDAYLAGDAAAALDIGSRRCAGVGPRHGDRSRTRPRRRLAAGCSPRARIRPLARRLAGMLRGLAEAARAAAREGRARLRSSCSPSRVARAAEATSRAAVAVDATPAAAATGPRPSSAAIREASEQTPAKRLAVEPVAAPAAVRPPTAPAPAPMPASHGPRRRSTRSATVERDHRPRDAGHQAAPARSAGRWRVDGVRLTLAFPEERGVHARQGDDAGSGHRGAARDRARRQLGDRDASPATSSSSR